MEEEERQADKPADCDDVDDDVDDTEHSDVDDGGGQKYASLAEA